MEITTLPTLERLKTLDARSILMLIDYLADQLDDDDMADSIRTGLSEAFSQIEEGYSYMHCYPAGYPARTRADWAKWDAYRDNRLAGVLA